MLFVVKTIKKYNGPFGSILLKFIIMLQESRASSSAKDNLKSTRGSFFNRAVGRDTRPTWGNRIVKDFYDLDYKTTIHAFSNPNKFKNTQLLQKQRLKADLTKRTNKNRKKFNPEQKRNLTGEGKNSTKRNKMLSLIMHQPERIQISTINTVPAKHCGLSPFEYSNTIEGKIQKRTSHHLSFQKDKLQRILNQNPIYYDRNKDLDFSHSQLLTQRHQLRKYHPFDSYLDRKVFEPRDELHKFFDTDSARRAASPRKIRETVRKFQKVLERKEAKLGQSARLTYEITGCLQLIQRRPQNYSIQLTPRQTILGPEVINPKRGCRR